MSNAPHPSKRERALHDRLARLFAEDEGLRAPDEPSSASTPPMRAFGRYLFIEPLGAGAAGSVWRARHKDLGHDVALKLLSAPNGADRLRFDRFRREARAAARLDHPGLARVHDFGVEDGVAYLAMDLVEGSRLDAWLAAQPDVDARMALIERIARAVDSAHRAGVLHRDLKPANVIVRRDGQPVVVDFGIAHLADELALTRAGEVLGTPRYMAPEQIRGDTTSLSPATDVFALGVLLHEAVFGRTPFDSADLVELEAQIDRGPKRPPASDGRAARAWHVCARALERDPTSRHASAARFADDVAAVRAGRAAERQSSKLATRLARAATSAVRRHARRLGVASAVIGFALVAGLAVSAQRTSSRLSTANAVQSAYHKLGSQLDPLLRRAEELRYRGGSVREREELVARADAISAETNDPTGVDDAYTAWIAWLVRDPRGGERLDRACAQHAKNPVPHVVRAWSQLRAYAEDARWPYAQPVNLDTRSAPMGSFAPRDTPAMSRSIDAALRDLARARDTRIWHAVSELAWVEDLCLGYESYARGDNAAAIGALERAGGFTDLALEPMLVLSFAYARANDLERAISTLERLLERRPEHATALRALSACHRQRGMADLCARGGGRADLERARELALRCALPGRADSDAAAAETALAFAAARSGADARELFEAAAASWDSVIQHDPLDPGALSNRSQCLTRAAEGSARADELLARALTDAERAHATAPEDAAVAEQLAGVRLLQCKHRLARGSLERGEIDALRCEIDAGLDRHGRFASMLFYAASAVVLEISLVERASESTSELHRDVARLLDDAIRIDPEFIEARFLRVWSELFRPASERASAAQIAHACRALFDASERRGAPLRASVALAPKLDELARDAREPAEDRELTDLALRAWDAVRAQRPLEPPRALVCARTTLRAACHAGALTRERLEQIVGDLETASRVEQLRHDADAWTATTWIIAADLGDGTWTAEACLDRARTAHARSLAAGTTSRDALVVAARLELEFDGNAGPPTLQRERAARSSQVAAVLCLASRAVALDPQRPAASYARAERGARVAAADDPDDPSHLATLGIASYRSGAWDEALDLLERAEAQRIAAGETSPPSDLAFLAMSAQRVGRDALAQSTWELFSDAAAQPRAAADIELAALMSETRLVLAREQR